MPGKINGPKVLEIEEQIKLPGHQWQLSSLDFSPNGLFLASGSWDKQIRIWDLSKLETAKILGEEKNVGHSAPVTALSWVPTIEFLVASSSADKTTILWNAEDANKMATFKEHTGWVLGSSFTKAGNKLATCSWDKTVLIWDITTLKCRGKLVGHTAGIWRCKFHTVRNDNILCTASEDSSLRLWDLRVDSSYRSQAVLLGAHDDSVRCCDWSPGGTYVAAGSTDMTISIWDTRENKVVTTIEGHEDTVTDVAFSPNGSSDSSPVLASVGDTSCRFWDVLRKNAKQLQCLRQHKQGLEVECVAISPDGSLLSTGGRDNDVILSTINIPDIGLENLYHEDTFISKGDYMWKKASREAFLTSSLEDVTGTVEKKVSSSAKLVDNAVQQHELKEQEKSQVAAKQTIKIKSSATNEMLQSKLMQLQKPKKVSAPEKPAPERPLSPESQELQNQRKKLHHIERSVSEPDDSDISRLISKDSKESERPKLRTVSNSEAISGTTEFPVYNFEISTSTLKRTDITSDGANYSSLRSTVSGPQRENTYESMHDTSYERSDGIDSLLYEDIRDITEELIRISDEQRKQILEEQRSKALKDQEPQTYDARL